MTSAYRDDNDIPTLIAALNTDGQTITRVLANPTNNGLEVSDGTTGSNHGPTDAPRDGNFVPVLMALSSSDGITPVVVYADSSGNLLIDST